jgi:hypothetical protein
VKALSAVFRAKYLPGPATRLRRRSIFAAGTAALADAQGFAAFVTQLRATPWVISAKRPFAGPEEVLDYLGRYMHRVALSNDRLVDHRDGRVRFRWRDSVR